ncbi:hypothetical protein Acr_28g0000710 [Actinidia rufa]|uniref:Uncharacterized protein n=1 Tax=Actinidia rufa TaxID=165716 RepID=A0A7J0H8F8_9ERIC|nr:hypothetical protein Acr_28g0000710 [Actinidia rufa]
MLRFQAATKTTLLNDHRTPMKLFNATWDERLRIEYFMVQAAVAEDVERSKPMRQERHRAG